MTQRMTAAEAIAYIDAHESEKDFQQRVIAHALPLGWVYYHTKDSRRSPAGFPDLVLVRDRIIYAELKTEKGRVSAKQGAWFCGLTRAGGECYVWRPSQWPEIVSVLA